VRAILGSALGPWDNYAIGPWECAAPGPGEIQVEVHSAGVTFVDALIASGRHQVQVALPFIPGNEVSGVVVAVGDGVTRVKVGDRVVYAKYAGSEIKLDEIEYLILSEKDILAVVANGKS